MAIDLKKISGVNGFRRTRVYKVGREVEAEYRSGNRQTTDYGIVVDIEYVPKENLLKLEAVWYDFKNSPYGGEQEIDYKGHSAVVKNQKQAVRVIHDFMRTLE